MRRTGDGNGVAHLRRGDAGAASGGSTSIELPVVRKRERAAFTLIELIVVMVIISLLVGMLLPALARAKDYARTIQCMSNMRQLGMAVEMYKNDNGGFFFPAAVDGYWGGDNRHRWHGVREDSTYDPVNPERFTFKPRWGMLYGYLAGRQTELLRCPAFYRYRQAGEVEWTNWMGITDTAPESGAGAYGYNDTYLGGTHYLTGYDASSYERTTREGDLGDWLNTVVFADTALAVQAGGEQYLVEYSFAQPPYFLGEEPWGSGQYKPQPSWGLATPTIHFRHGGCRRANVLWTDGHVSGIQWSFTNPINAYGGNNVDFAIGWPGSPGNDLFDAY